MSASRPRLSLRGLTKDFDAMRAVDDVSLELAPGEIHALCGHNGAGKSTVLNMLAGIVEADAGEIFIDGERHVIRDPRQAQAAGIARVDQELSVIGELTVAENMVLGGVVGDGLAAGGLRGRRALARRTHELLDHVGLRGVEPGRRMSTLSLGQRQLVEIARALGRNARILILDEPTATLNELEIDHVFGAVRGVSAQGCAVIFVSHRLGEVLALCDRVTVMRDGRCTHSSATADVTAGTLVVAMLGAQPEPADGPADERVVELGSLSITKLAVAGRLTEFTYELRRGRVYGVAGQVGSGASALLRSVAGLEPRTSGHVELDGRPLPLGRPTACTRRGIAYASNDRKGEGLFLGRSVAENLTATRLDAMAGALRRGGGVATRRAARPLAEIAHVPTERLHSPAKQLSGGNQQKVLVARSLRMPRVRALLVDEPTRGVDVAGRAAIHRLLRDAAGAGLLVVFASSELEELEELADTTITMRGGRRIASYDGVVSKQQILDDLTHRELVA